MDMPKSGVRGFFEILMPGVFLLLNLLGTVGVLVVACTPDGQRASVRQAKTDTTETDDRTHAEENNAVREFIGNPTYALSLVLSAGYLFGVVLRLLRTQAVDTLSSKFLRVFKRKWRNEPFLTEPFFFHKWMRDKYKRRCDPEVGQFYDRFWGPRNTDDAYQNTTFFNLTKSILAKIDPCSANEAFAAEAMCRFVAGSFYALIAALVLLIADCIIVGTCFGSRLTIIPLAVGSVYTLLVLIILGTFRLLRCKEVDTVFDACFANREEFEKYFPMVGPETNPNSAEKGFAERRGLIETAWRDTDFSRTDRHFLSLEKLVAQMKHDSKSAPHLSCLYFAGADVDHPYFLKNQSVAIGLAVLPEDAAKARRRKRHPHQIEVLFVLQGKLDLCWEESGKETKKVLSENDCHVIPKDTYHWIVPHEGEDAAFLFVKTNPAQEPRSEA